MPKRLNQIIGIMHDLLYSEPYVNLEAPEMGEVMYGQPPTAKHFSKMKAKLLYRNKFLDQK